MVNSVIVPTPAIPGEGQVGSCGGAVLVLPRWYLIQTKPAGEETARVNLERQAYGVYYPRVQQRKLRRGRWCERISALFPRYLFLRLDPQQSLAPVRSTLGVADAVRFGSKYAAVPEAVVDGLIERADPETGLHHVKCSLFTVGATVRVIAGAFAGLEGIFERETGQDRVTLLLELLGREIAVTVPTGFVAPGYA